MEKNQTYWKGKPPHLDSIQFRVAGNLTAMMEGFRSGKFDLVRELQPSDLDTIFRERHLQTTYVEAPLKNVWFILFNQSSPFCSRPEFRKALTGILRTQDLVRSALGRLAQPAEGFLPPGIFGHDPGRRRSPIPIEKAKELIAKCGFSTPVRLKLANNPATRTRYSSLLNSLFRIWSDLGVEVVEETPSTERFLKSITENEGLDLIFIRWIGDYEDPDAFTYSLFHSEIGEFRKYYSSKELDALMTAARLEESPEKREQMYRKLEDLFIQSANLFPLFHDVNYRLASPQVGNLKLSSNAPYVNYSELTKQGKAPAVRTSRPERGIIRVPILSKSSNLDPSLVSTVMESLPNEMIFETLTRAAEGARIIPWLASSFQTEEGGKRYRFHLRDGVRFHDGKRLTSRDVRYTFERYLLNEQSAMRNYLSAIRGGQNLLEGKSRELEGFHIISAQDFWIDLEQPLSFFPAMLSSGSMAIVPEGLDHFQGSWQQGLTGTGPFRIVSYEPDKSLKLEANPWYWRAGFPKSEYLEFTYNVNSSDSVSGLKSGKFSLAFFLDATDLQALLHDPQFAATYKEIAWLNTLYACPNTQKGFFADEKSRKAVMDSLDVETLIGRNSRFATPARTLTPPALLGYEPERPLYRSSRARFDNIEIKVTVSDRWQDSNADLCQEIFRILGEMGIQCKVSVMSAEDIVSGKAMDEDLVLVSWVADYPDPDGVVYPLLHSTGGIWNHRTSTPEIDLLIERARTETDPDVRHSLYRRIEEGIRNRAIVFPLLHDRFQGFVRPEVEGLDLNYFFPIIPFENLSIHR